MTIDQSLTPFAQDGGKAQFQSGRLSTEKIKGVPGGERDDHGETVPGLSMQPIFPTWPRVYPSL
jgi:hypothetical protein